MTPRPRVLVIQTGGTIAMRAAGGGPLLPEQSDAPLTSFVPDLEKVVDLEGMDLASIDSTDMTPDLWESIAETIAQHRELFRGFVVLHGTDTMAYTAAALSFQLRNLDRPVVLTGAQRPISEVRTDARANLANAISCALLDIPEVCVCFGRTLLRGNRSTKGRIQDLEAFVSPNVRPLLRIGVELEPQLQPLRPSGPFHWARGFCQDIAVLRLFPGLSPDVMRALVDRGARAVVLRAFGAGNVPLHGWPDAIAAVRSAGVPVILTSQCAEGWVMGHLYAGGRKAVDAGAVPSGAMTVEAAIVKAMHLVGQGLDADAFDAAFVRDLAGEGVMSNTD